ncbi:hypothetical protein KEK_21794 [Mycolicibacterium thermoresistibile ATCC 19527]|jgi:hypothetical protein|uniref:Uncharacterized protein n=2 Tax=Mycolicibacterium thermoresistibile TaxID=1797 RepID=G7CMW1_MYCT3|nr:hypothetical protein KEK_21794 [Mycolicibacterium thermoresistibile ATCC 19527]
MSLTTADSSIESACGTLAVRAEELAIKVAEAAAMYLGEDESSAVSVKKAMRIFP